MGGVAFKNVEPLEYETFYYHDYHGWRDTMVDTIEAFNAFVATDNHYLTAVSFYTAANNVEYTVKVYNTFTEAGQLEDELVTESEIIEQTGFHTINLPSAVQLSKGDDFYIYLSLSDGGQPFDRTSYIKVLMGLPNPNEHFKYSRKASFLRDETEPAGVLVESIAHEGESYYWDGTEWRDLFDYDLGEQNLKTANFCIKGIASM